MTLLVAVAFVLLGLQKPQPGFLGLKVGMKAATALPIAGKDPEVLQHVKAHEGQRVIADTVAVAECKLPMRRFLGFDSLSTLTAIGLTYRTTPEDIEQASDCAFQWLTSIYGPPTTESETDSVKQEVWQFDAVKLTFEAKKYNPRDVFVLIYYYKDSK